MFETVLPETVFGPFLILNWESIDNLGLSPLGTVPETVLGHLLHTVDAIEVFLLTTRLFLLTAGEL